KNIQIRAVMIAVYAESAKAGPEKKLLTAYADAGLKLARAAVVSAKVADVKKLADALAKAKPGANGKLGNVDWKKELDAEDDVMHPMDKLSKGGDGLPKSLQTNIRLKGNLNGVEDKIKELARRAPRQPSAEADEINLMAKKVAAIAN